MSKRENSTCPLELSALGRAAADADCGGWRLGRRLAADEVRLVVVKAGCVNLRRPDADGQRAAAGAAVLAGPGAWLELAPEGGWAVEFLALKGLLVAPALGASPAAATVVPLDAELTAAMTALVAVGSAPAFGALALKALALVVELAERVRPPSGVEAVRRTLAHFHAHLAEVIDFPALAAMAELGYTRYRQLFREVTGFSPLEYQQRLRLDRAQELLVTTELPVSEVARRCGFRSAAYFARYFHAELGCSPGAYRRESRE